MSWLVPLSCPRDYFVIVPGTYVPETYFPGTYFPGTWYLNKKGNWSQGLQLKHRERACCTYVQLGHISQGHVFSRKTRQPTFWAGLAEPLDPPPWSQIVFFVWRPSWKFYVLAITKVHVVNINTKAIDMLSWLSNSPLGGPNNLFRRKSSIMTSLRHNVVT